MAEIAERLGFSGEVNVGQNERLASILGGAGLGLLAARQRGIGGALLGLAGAYLIARGATGHCFVYDAAGLDTAEGRPSRGRMAADEDAGVSVNASITVDRAPEDAYALWRDFRNAPKYMERIVRVEILDEVRSRWTATGPLGRTWTWECEVVEDRPGELIAWESLPGAELPNRGWVQFLPAADDGRRAEVRYFVQMDPPGGIIGGAVAKAFHDAPRELARGDLRRFRAFAAAQEIAAALPPAAGAGEEGVSHAG